MVLNISISAEVEADLKAKASAAGIDLETFAARQLTLVVAHGRSLQPDKAEREPQVDQQRAWESFVSGMTAWSKTHLPNGYVADDSREAAYDGRS